MRDFFESWTTAKSQTLSELAFLLLSDGTSLSIYGDQYPLLEHNEIHLEINVWYKKEQLCVVQEGAIMCGARSSNYVWCKKEQLCVVQEGAFMCGARRSIYVF